MLKEHSFNRYIMATGVTVNVKYIYVCVKLFLQDVTKKLKTKRPLKVES